MARRKGIVHVIPSGGKCSRALTNGKRELTKAVDAALTLDLCKRTKLGANSCVKEFENYRYSTGFKYPAMHAIEEACGEFDDKFENIWLSVLRAVDDAIEVNRK